MGEILGAMDEQIGREVAVKRMKERNPSSHAMGRFLRERGSGRSITRQSSRSTSSARTRKGGRTSR
jgi:hypothetical protein